MMRDIFNNPGRPFYKSGKHFPPSRMDAKLANLIDQLAKTAPVDDISDADIDSEIKTVRQMGK